MRLECVKPDISENNFLRLLISTIVVQKKGRIFTNIKLQRDLYNFYDIPEFHILFEDIIKREDKVFKENSYIDLSISLQSAYIFGLLIMLQGNHDLKSIINISQKEAEQIISEFSSDFVEAMKNLCTKLHIN